MYIPLSLPPRPLGVPGSDVGRVRVLVAPHPLPLLLTVGIVRVHVRGPAGAGIGGPAGEGGGDRQGKRFLQWLDSYH